MNPQAKCVVSVSEANLRQSHIYLNGAIKLFPPECIGPASSRDGVGELLHLDVEGLPDPVLTDIPRDAKTGRPRCFFRRRSWVRRFFQVHRVQTGDLIAIERLNKYRYKIHPEPPATSFSAGEFFAGIGLVRLALERQGWRVVFANDIDPKKAEMYRANWPRHDHLVVGDIHNLRAGDLPHCDLFTASFPCNDLSIAGRWEGLNGKQSSAFWGLMRLLRQLGDQGPPLVMLENVVGFLMRRHGRDLEEALKALNELGYLVDVLIINAVHWVPQSRARLFVIGTRDRGQTLRSFAMESDVRPTPLMHFINAHQGIRWNLAELPPLPREKCELKDILEDLPSDDPHWWDERRAQYFMTQLSRKHDAQATAMISGRRIQYATAFRRVRKSRSMAELRTDGIAGCLRTPRGGSGRQILFKAGRGKYQVRLLTARECARLQGVPEDYKISVPLNQALFGFGDAVCVPVVRWVVKHILNPAIHSLTDPQGNRRGGQSDA